MNSTSNFKMLKLSMILALDNKLLKFKGNIKPAHEGWYLCHFEHGRFKGFYRWFDNEWWHDCSTDEGIIHINGYR